MKQTENRTFFLLIGVSSGYRCSCCTEMYGLSLAPAENQTGESVDTERETALHSSIYCQYFII